MRYRMLTFAGTCFARGRELVHKLKTITAKVQASRLLQNREVKADWSANYLSFFVICMDNFTCP